MSSKSTFSNSTSESYALALYEISKENSELNKIEEDMKDLNQLLNVSYEFKETIINPTIAKEDKASVISIIAENNNFSKTAVKFLGFIAMKNRLFFLDKIIQSFLNLVSINKGELKAKIVSSKKLSIEEQRKIQSELSENFKSKLNIDYEYDPNLIVGLTVQVGSIMIDASIKTKLKKLEKVMLEVWYAN